MRRPRRQRPRLQAAETGEEVDQVTSGKTPSRHVDGVLDMAAKAYRLGKVALARRLLARLDNEPLAPEQAARRERALRILEEDQGR